MGSLEHSAMADKTEGFVINCASSGSAIGKWYETPVRRNQTRRRTHEEGRMSKSSTNLA